LVCLAAPGAYGQGQGQFGGQSRADAASQMIVLAVQQGISSLPPTSGQSFSYEYDPDTLTFVASEVLGPTAFRSAQTVGKGRFTFRAAGSYFEISDSFGPITYFIEPKDPELAGPRGYAKFGLEASAQVGLINLSANYGITNRFEVMLNLPVVIVDAQASQKFTTAATALDLPADEATVDGALTEEQLDEFLDVGALVVRTETFDDLGFDFNSGTHGGLGRVSIGAKGIAYAGKWARLALAPELFLPSPNECEFAGPDSVAVLPRVIGQLNAADFLRFHIDVGYDHDFDSAELRRFVWNVGASIPHERFSVDFGVGGSEFEQGIRWTPSVAESVETDEFPATVLTAQEGNRLGTSFIDFLAGLKMRLSDRLVLGGAVTVPLNDEGFRPDALGTAALEFHL
jgi:hypothetical protein